MRWPLGRSMLVVSFATLAVPLHGAVGRDAGQPSPILQRFLTAPDPPPLSYRALRHLDAENEHFATSAWMDVWTEADAHGFRYEIAAEGGSEFIRSRVFHETLDMERRMWTNGAARRGAITPANYIFEERAAADDGLPSFLVRPRRKDVLLIDGFIVLNSDDGELVRVEGTLSKAPSFWTRRVHLTRWYQRFDGVRLPVDVESVANVLVAGRSTLRMRYEYEQVNDHRVGAPQLRTARQ